MPTYLTPGVYVEEVPSANKPIEGVGTAVAAFVGFAPGGPVNQAVRVSNWTQFAKMYGDSQTPEHLPFMEGAYLAHAVYGFFQNGGTACWVVRVGAGNGGAEQARASLPAATDAAVEALRAVAQQGIEGPVTVELHEEPPAPDPEGGGDGKDREATYTMVVTAAGGQREEHPGLTLKKGRTFLATRVNASSKLITIEETGASLPEMRVAPGTYSLSIPPAENGAISPGDFEGDVTRREGIGGLEAIDEVTMLVAPDLMALARDGDGAQVRDVQGKMIAHCENSGDRMAILDTPPDLDAQRVFDWRMQVAGYDSKMSALYYPWLQVMDPITRHPIMVPPSGHVAGVWSRVDARRGVHKAPANEVVLGALGPALQVTHSEHGRLNQVGINVISAPPGRGVRILGGRTLSSDPEWRYINVRRLMNFIGKSVMAGTQWSVFEPNDRMLWTQLSIAVSNFLPRVWRSGALFGATPSEAFFVKCDSETNPPEVIEAGQVVCEIGVAPVKPAEFVIFRLSQFVGGGGAEIEE